MTLTFFGPAEPGLFIPEDWTIHNVSELLFDSREVQVTVNGRCVKIASVVHYGDDGRFVKYVIYDNGWFGLFGQLPKYSRLAYSGMKCK